jgi:hypothetical protein
VYDEVLFHWGLETDSRFGEWYRELGLEVLGEDPLFDKNLSGFDEMKRVGLNFGDGDLMYDN